MQGCMLVSDHVGDVLGQLRRRRGWSVASLARRSGLPSRTVVGLEAGTLSLDPDLGGTLMRALAADDPSLHAMAMLCCLTFQAEMDRLRALNVLVTCGVAGYA